jgi:hypothetical protein
MTAHTASDNHAITAAEIAKLVNAKKAVLAAAQRLVERPVRWNRLALESAAVALCDEYVTSMERELGRKPGAFRSSQMSLVSTGRLVMGDSGPTTCAELDGDCA